MKKIATLLLLVLCAGSLSAQDLLEVKRVGLDSLVSFLRRECNPEIYYIPNTEEQASFTVSAPRASFLEAALAQLRENGYTTSRYGDMLFILNNQSVFTSHGK